MKCLKIIVSIMLLSIIPLQAKAEASLQNVQQLIDQGKLDQALAQTEEVLASDAANIEARFLKGLLLAKAERLGEAETVFVALTEDHPELPEPYNNLAVVYAALGKFDKAQESLKKAINTHPSYATAHENLGDIYAKMASRAYNQALELDDGNASAREKLLLIRDLFSSGEVSRPEPPEKVAAVTPPPAPAASKTPAPAVVEKQPGPVVEPAAPTLEVDPAISKAIYDWAAAWSAQNVNAYLSSYASSFSPEGMSRTAWSEKRKVRLTKPSFIRVEISSPRISMISNNSARAEFVQAYASDNYKDQVKKVLMMVKENGNWRIKSEASQ